MSCDATASSSFPSSHLNTSLLVSAFHSTARLPSHDVAIAALLRPVQGSAVGAVLDCIASDAGVPAVVGFHGLSWEGSPNT